VTWWETLRVGVGPLAPPLLITAAGVAQASSYKGGGDLKKRAQHFTFFLFEISFRPSLRENKGL
jgi:hypothetical protein